MTRALQTVEIFMVASSANERQYQHVRLRLFPVAGAFGIITLASQLG